MKSMLAVVTFSFIVATLSIDAQFADNPSLLSTYRRYLNPSAFAPTLLNRPLLSALSPLPLPPPPPAAADYPASFSFAIPGLLPPPMAPSPSLEYPGLLPAPTFVPYNAHPAYPAAFAPLFNHPIFTAPLPASPPTAAVAYPTALELAIPGLLPPPAFATPPTLVSFG